MAHNVQALPKEGYFITSSLAIKVNRISTRQKSENDRAKPVTLKPKLISDTNVDFTTSAPLLTILCYAVVFVYLH
jgi:hypothetical protein